MKLSRMYSNRPNEFSPIEFVSGLNVVLAEIRLPENRKKDTHNLGKTTLGRMLDFGFLASRDANFFLFKHSGLFSDFVFFFEMELADGSYVSVRRSVAEASKVAFKKHTGRHQDFSTLPVHDWDHSDSCLSMKLSKAAETQRMSHRGFQSLCHIRVRTVQLPPTSL